MGVSRRYPGEISLVEVVCLEEEVGFMRDHRGKTDMGAVTVGVGEGQGEDMVAVRGSVGG